MIEVSGGYLVEPVIYLIPVGFEVNTRSGTYPAIPYVKQEDGSWKPKYGY